MSRVRRDLIVLVASLAVFAICAVVAADGQVGPVERAAFHAINGLPAWLYQPMLLFQYLGVLAMPLVVAVGDVDQPPGADPTVKGDAEVRQPAGEGAVEVDPVLRLGVGIQLCGKIVQGLPTLLNAGQPSPLVIVAPARRAGPPRHRTPSVPASAR